MHLPSLTSTARGLAGLTVVLLSACSGIERATPADHPAPDFVMLESVHAAATVERAVLARMASIDGPDGRRVYLHMAGCCDQFNKVYDDGGRFLCAPSGGITGQGDGRCPAWLLDRLNGRARDIRFNTPAVWRQPGNGENPLP